MNFVTEFKVTIFPEDRRLVTTIFAGVSSVLLSSHTRRLIMFVVASITNDT